MISIFFTFLLFAICYGQQQNCEQFVGKKVEYTVTDIKEQNPAISGFNEFFKGGKIETWNATGSVVMIGNYTFRNSDDAKECYMEIDWAQTTVQQECVTFSPTANGLGMTGCYVFNTNCVAECTIDAMSTLGSWYAAVVIQ